MVLASGKAAAGVLGNSAALVADAGHSLADLLGDVMALATIKFSTRPAGGSYSTVVMGAS